MKCSKGCGLEAVEGQRWCAPCRRAYQREYRRTVAVKAVRSAKREGAERFKLRVIQEFERIGEREMNGLTAAAIVERMEL